MRGHTLFLTNALAFAALGVALGRGRLLWLVIPAPIVFWWIWYRQNYGGPDDDITGIAATLLTGAGLIGVSVGIGVHQLARWYLRSRRRASN